MKIGSAVADKHGRRAASRRTCYKQIRWTLSVIILRPNYIRWQRFVSKVAKLQIPHLYFTYPTCIWRLRWGRPRLLLSRFSESEN